MGLLELLFPAFASQRVDIGMAREAWLRERLSVVCDGCKLPFRVYDVLVVRQGSDTAFSLTSCTVSEHLLLLCDVCQDKYVETLDAANGVKVVTPMRKLVPLPEKSLESGGARG